MTVISSTNIESAAYANVFSVIDNRTNIVDPRQKGFTNATTQKRPFVYDYDPFMRSINHKDMPYNILLLPNPEYSKFSADGKTKFVTWKQTIIVRTTRAGASNQDTDIGRNDMLDICDDLQETFNSKSIRQTFLGNNMYEMNLVKSDSTFDVIENVEIYESTFELTYMVRLVVSS